jgi:hypothetical protein
MLYIQVHPHRFRRFTSLTVLWALVILAGRAAPGDLEK